MTAPADILIGLDIGGTSLKAVRMRPDGTEPETITVPAGGSFERDVLLDRLSREVQRLARGDVVRRIGCAVGGLVTPDGTMPADATNLPSLAGVPLAPLFRGALGAPCHVLNDARAALHGEAWLGAAGGRSDVLLVTLGTGIGAGLMLGGRIRDGAHGACGELGAWPLGRESTFEAMAAPGSFERRHGARLGDAIVSGASSEGVADVLDAIGRCLAKAHMLLDVELIVIGGSISATGEPLRSAVEAAFQRHCPPAYRHGVEIATSRLGAYAGAIGAVAPSAWSDGDRPA